MPKHYDHISSTILSFFNKLDVLVEIEPSGSRGPDVRGLGYPLVGEVKHETELQRDLHSKFWKDWNSSQRFGGKTAEYHLADHLPGGTDLLSDHARGWLAVIWGQLRYMVRDAGLSDGWIIYENHNMFEQSLLEATSYLSLHSYIYADPPMHSDSVGFCKIAFIV